MQRYLAARILQGLVTMLLVSAVIFALARSTGDPAVLMLPFTATPDEVAAMRHRLGTDRPLAAQYISFLGDVATGNLGTSTRLRVPVRDLLLQHLPASLALASAALAIALALALVLGTIGALTRGTAADALVRLVGVLGLSLPPFWLGIVAIELFAVRLGWLPTSGTGTPRHAVLPALTLSLFVSGGLMRLLRSSLLEALGSQYVLVAGAKGLPRAAILLRHALPNALLPMVGFAGVYFPLLISSAVVVETVFAWPGVGRLGFQAIVSRDFPMIQGVTLLGSGLVVATSLVVDTLYGVIDPRVRYG